MNQNVIVQEVAIVIAAKNHNPNILNPDFLKYSGIVPTDWELARPPQYTNRAAQVTFTQGISIVAEPNRVIFLEAIEGKDSTAIFIPEIARKYVETLSNVEYQAIGLNFRGYLSFEQEPEVAGKYVTETLLSPGSCQSVGIAPVRATVNFVYTLERGSLYLSVNEATLRYPDEKTIPVVLFTGNFSYDIASETKEERLKKIYQALDNWQADLDIYKDIVNTKLPTKLAENTLAVNSPELAMSAA